MSGCKLMDGWRYSEGGSRGKHFAAVYTLAAPVPNLDKEIERR